MERVDQSGALPFFPFFGREFHEFLIKHRSIQVSLLISKNMIFLVLASQDFFVLATFMISTLTNSSGGVAAKSPSLCQSCSLA